MGQGLKTLLTNINVSGYAGAADEAFTAIIAQAAADLTKTINIGLTGTNLGSTAGGGAFEITIANDSVAGGTAANPNNTYGTWSITANNNTNLLLDQDTGEGVGGATGLTLAGAGTIAVGQEAAGDWQFLKTIDATKTTNTVFLTGATSGTATQARASATNPGWLFGAGAGLLNDTGAAFNLTSVLLGSGMTFLDVSSASVAQVTALTTAAGAGVTVNAGNEIIVKNSVATTISATTFTNIKGFSALGIGGATAADGAGGVINMTNLPATINTIEYITAASAGVNINNPVATLTLNTFDNGVGQQLTVGAVGPQAAGTFTLNVGNTFLNPAATPGAVGTAVPLHTAGVRIIGEQNVNINSIGANGNVVGLVELSRTGGVGAENVAIGGNKNLTIGVTGDGAIFDVFPSQATNTPPITAVTNSLQITITNTGTTTFLSSANTAVPGFGDLIVPGDSVHGPGGPAAGGGFPLTTSTNAVSIDATASGGLIMQGGDFNYTPSLSVAGSIGDSILGSTTGANVLGGSIGNDVLQALSINAANTIFTSGGGDAVTLGVGHVVGDNVDIYVGFSTAGITPGQAEVVRFQSITASSVAVGDIPQLGWFNQATAATATGYAGATAATSTYAGLAANTGTAGDVTTVTNFNPAIDLLTLSDGTSGYQVGGPVNAFGGAVRGLVEGNLSSHTTAAGATGTAAVLQVLTGGTLPAGNTVNANTDLIELEGHTYSSATAVANELATNIGSQIFFTNGAAMVANTSGHIYMAWSDFSNQVHIADAAWINSSGAHAAGAVLPSLDFTWHISELATLPGVSITGLGTSVNLMHN